MKLKDRFTGEEREFFDFTDEDMWEIGFCSRCHMAHYKCSPHLRDDVERMEAITFPVYRSRWDGMTVYYYLNKRAFEEHCRYLNGIY